MFIASNSFEPIRRNLDRLEWRREPLEQFVKRARPGTFDGFNLSDIFEYVPADHYRRTLDDVARAGKPGARLAYWNLLAPRRCAETRPSRVRPLDELAARLHRHDCGFFYSAFVLEEVAPGFSPAEVLALTDMEVRLAPEVGVFGGGWSD